MDMKVERSFSVQHTKTGENMSNDHKMYQMGIKYTIWPSVDNMAIKISTSSIATPSKIYPNWEFWFENYTIWQH
jgi:hypothetical protein